jgi:ankyrin repeat protein
MATSILSYSLPSEKEFKHMCNSIYEHTNATNLQEILYKTSDEECITWISNFNRYYQSPMVYAVHSGNIPIIRILLDLCIKLNLVFHLFTKLDGTSMLTIAAKENNTELIEFLLENNHPIKFDTGNNSVSALHIVAIQNNITAFKLILKYQKDNQLLHQPDYNSFTPINYLIENSQQDFILELLQLFPIDKNNPPLSKDNMSYLHYAVIYDMYHVVKLLLQQGLNCSQKSIIGLTPLDLSKIHRNHHITNLLLSCLDKKKYSRFKTLSLNRIKYKILCCYIPKNNDYNSLY